MCPFVGLVDVVASWWALRSVADFRRFLECWPEGMSEAS